MCKIDVKDKILIRNHKQRKDGIEEMFYLKCVVYLKDDT